MRYLRTNKKLTTHYLRLLGLAIACEVEDVNLSLTSVLIEVRLRFIGIVIEELCCECHILGTVYDHASGKLT